MRTLLSAKIHKARVTHANVSYVGSITIDENLLSRVDLWPGEKVLVVSNTSGARLETYIIRGEPGSGVVQMNGAAAHLITVDEEVIIIAFQRSEVPVEARQILVDGQNRFVRNI